MGDCSPGIEGGKNEYLQASTNVGKTGLYGLLLIRLVGTGGTGTYHWDKPEMNSHVKWEEGGVEGKVEQYL